MGDQTLPFLAANHKLIAKVEELEHKSRRQDVLVDELIYFYDLAPILATSSAGTARHRPQYCSAAERSAGVPRLVPRRTLLPSQPCVQAADASPAKS